MMSTIPSTMRHFKAMLEEINETAKRRPLNTVEQRLQSQIPGWIALGGVVYQYQIAVESGLIGVRR